MSDEDALLAAIIANPAEDTPRLAYADWLQENGDEDRAEFIRLQCLRASGEWECDRLEREQQLLTWNRWPWIGLTVNDRPAQEGSWGFRRGFPECLWVELPTLARWHRDFARVVCVREVCITQATAAGVERLPNLEWGANWERLKLETIGLFREVATPEMLRALGDCPAANRLKQLTLSGFRVPSHAVPPLVTLLEEVRGLATIVFESCGIEPRTLQLLRDRFGGRVCFTGRHENGEPIGVQPLTITPML